MCLFVNTLRPEVTLRIWDMFFNEGSKVLFRIAAALFKLHEKQLVAVKVSPSFLVPIQQAPPPTPHLSLARTLRTCLPR